jgi:small multidrug resistance pump
LHAWVYLAIAIVAEVVATSALKAADGFTRPGPSAVVIAGYVVAFYCLSLVLRTIPVGITYAIWSGVGIVLIALIAWLVYGQTLDFAAVVGLGLIIAGVVVLNVFSETMPR